MRLHAIAGKDFTITSPTAFAQARPAAEFLARHSHLPLADTTTEHEVVLAPEHAGDSLRQRLRRGAMERPAAPPQMRSRVTESERETVIVIPKRMSRMAALICGAGSAVALLVAVPLFWRLLSADPTSAAHHLISFGATLFFFGIFPVSTTALVFGLMRQKAEVTASPAGLTIKRRGPYRAPIPTIPTTDILDIDCSTSQGMLEAQANAIHQQTPRVDASLIRLVPNKGVVIQTRTGLVSFGEGLSAEELSYLVWVLKNRSASD